jgi:hypothetical protein
VRFLSSLVAAIGKIPVVTPPIPLTACGLHMLLSHWSLAVSLVSVYGGNITTDVVDQALLSAGYSMGPFQAMKKVCSSMFEFCPPAMKRIFPFSKLKDSCTNCKGVTPIHSVLTPATGVKMLGHRFLAMTA